MRHAAVCATALVALALAAPAASASPTSGDLYLQQATGGKLSGSKLVLTGVSGRVTTFTDRPQRSASSTLTSTFVRGFSKTFRGDPPNAALQIDGASTRRDVAILELRRPRYDRKARTLTYTVRRLRSTKRGGLQKLAKRADRGVSGRFGRATLFIDSGGAGDYFFIQLSAPAGQTSSVSLSGGAAFDLEERSQIFPQGSPTPLLSFSPTSMSVQDLGSSGSASMVVETWIDVSGNALTGTATLPPGATGAIITGGSTTPLTNGAFSIPF